MKFDWKIPLVLGLVCLISTVLLSFTYYFMKPIIGSVEDSMLRESLSQLIEADDFTILSGIDPAFYSKLNTSGLEEIYLAESLGSTVGSIFLLNSPGYGGGIRFLVAVSGDKIKDIKILAHLETPGLGNRIEDASFTSQFNDAPLSKKHYDTITGATISSSSVIDAVKKKAEFILSTLSTEEKQKLGLN